MYNLKNMTKYTEEQINWAIEQLRNKGVKELTRERAIKLLETFDDFEDMVKGKIEKDKKSGKLKSKAEELN